MKQLMVLASLVLAACTTTHAGHADGRPDRIAYETGPCFGACPVYKVVVDGQGNGSFEGIRFTAVTGQRTFTLTRDQYQAFARQLAPLRPRQGEVRYSGAPLCKMMATDLPSASVTWEDADGSRQSLYFYYGCDMEERRVMADRLRTAPDLLPIRAFIKAVD